MRIKQTISLRDDYRLCQADEHGYRALDGLEWDLLTAVRTAVKSGKIYSFYTCENGGKTHWNPLK